MRTYIAFIISEASAIRIIELQAYVRPDQGEKGGMSVGTALLLSGKRVRSFFSLPFSAVMQFTPSEGSSCSSEGRRRGCVRVRGHTDSLLAPP